MIVNKLYGIALVSFVAISGTLLAELIGKSEPRNKLRGTELFSRSVATSRKNKAGKGPCSIPSSRHSSPNFSPDFEPATTICLVHNLRALLFSSATISNMVLTGISSPFV